MIDCSWIDAHDIDELIVHDNVELQNEKLKQCCYSYNFVSEVIKFSYVKYYNFYIIQSILQ